MSHPADIYWHLPVLLIAFSLVYSGTRHDRWDRILWEAAGWAGRVAGFLALVGGVLYLLSNRPGLWPAVTAVLAAVGVASLVYPYVATAGKSAAGR